MIDFCELVYDGPVSDVPQYTPERTWSLLGHVDRVYLHALVSNGSGAGVQLNLDLQTSNDGVGWFAKGAGPKQTLAATGTLYNLSHADAGTTPGGCLLRLAVYMTGAWTSCYAQIWATGRDD